MALVATAGTPITFGGEAAADVAFSVEGILTVAGRQSATKDLGAVTAINNTYRIDGVTQWQATPAVGDELRLFIKMQVEEGSTWTNDDGTGDIALSALDKTRNLYYVGAITCDEAAANIATAKDFGIHEISVQNIALVVYNASGASIHATDTSTIFTLTPISYSDV